MARRPQQTEVDPSKSDLPPGFSPTRLTVDEFSKVVTLYKQLLAENPLVRFSIYAAGFGGLLEGFHILWLIVRYLARF